MNKKQTAVLIASLAGILFSAATFSKQKSNQASVKCVGANKCKGQSACQTASSGCKGMNQCKGQGYIMTASKKECAAKGGKSE